jgi:hypothetical protein
VGLGIENYVLGPPDEPGESGPRVGGKLTVGVDWRYDRNYSLGAMIEIHTAFDDPGDFPIYSTLGLNWSYHFRL